VKYAEIWQKIGFLGNKFVILPFEARKELD
jgi:hypothetical protein